MLRGLMLGVLGLMSCISACLAESGVSPGSVIFDFPHSSLGNFILPDGEEYFFTRYIINQRSDGPYYVDRYYNRRLNGEIDRLYRTVIAFDAEGKASLDMNPKTRQDDIKYKLVRWVLPESNFSRRVEDYFRRRKLMAQSDREMPEEPYDFDRYIADGLLVKSFPMSCDPLADYTRVSFARTDSSLKRINEVNHKRSLVMLSDVPAIMNEKYYFSGKCPVFVEKEGYLKPEANVELQLRAVSADFDIYRLEHKFLLATSSYPFAVLVDNLAEDFCIIIESRDVTGKPRRIAFMYTSVENLSRLLPNVWTRRDSETVYQRYTKDNLISFDVLSRSLSDSSCTTVRRP